MDKLKGIMMSFALSTRWVVNFLHGLADALAMGSGEAGTFAKIFVTSTAVMIALHYATRAYKTSTALVAPILGKLGLMKAKDTAATVTNTTTLKALTAARAKDTLAIKANTRALKAQTVAQKTLGKAQKTVGKATSISAKQMLAFGAAILLVGAGVYMAATGVGNLVSSFKGLGDMAPYAVAGIALLMAGLVALGLVFVVFAAPLTVATWGMLAFGGAITLIGAGIMLIGTGISIAINSITRLISVLAKLKIDSLTQLSDAMSSMADFGSRNIGAGSSLVEFRRTVNAIVRLENVKGIEHTKGVVDQIMRLKNEAPTVNITQKASETKPIELTINLDGKGIYKKVHKDLNEKLEIQTYTR